MASASGNLSNHVRKMVTQELLPTTRSRISCWSSQACVQQRGWAKRPMAAQQIHVPPNRGFPLILAMAGLPVYWIWLNIAAAWLPGLKGLLRRQDLLESTSADLTYNAARGKMLLSIPDSKAGRKSVTWSIKGQDCFSSLVLVLKEDQMPGDFLFNSTEAHCAPACVS